MEKEILNKMKKYLSPQHIVNAVVFASGFILLVMTLILKPMLSTTPNKKVDNIIGLIVFIGFLSFIIGLVEKIKLNMQIKSLKKSGELSRVLNDFQYSQPMYNGGIMLGKEYIFGKNYTRIVRYSDIDRVYLCIHTTNGVKNQRILQAKLKNGKEVKLCCLKVFKNTKDEEQAIIDVIVQNNPHIQLGYNK